MVVDFDTDGIFRSTQKMLDRTLSDIKAVVRALRTLRSVKVAQLRRQRNSLSQVSRLPVEIMASVFAEHLAARLYDGSGRSIRLLTLSSVCSTWYDVIRRAPGLWTNLDTRVAPSFIHIALENSKSALISVTGPVQGKPHTKESFLAICLHTARWSSIHLTAPHSDDFDILECSSTALRLKNIDLSCDLRRRTIGGGRWGGR